MSRHGARMVVRRWEPHKGAGAADADAHGRARGVLVKDADRHP